MKIRYNINTCDHNPKDNEIMIHFTKACPNNCPFCIDKVNVGVKNNKTDVNAIINSIVRFKDKVNYITISGGEPFIFMDDLDVLVTWIKSNTTAKLNIITSVPDICFDNKEKFFTILDKCDNVQLSLQHYVQAWAAKIKNVEMDYHRDRNEFYKEILEHCGSDKILGSINILKPYFEFQWDILNTIKKFNQLGFKNIKICEMFDADDIYVDIPKALNMKVNSPFAWGCKTEIKNVDKLYKGTELEGFHFDGHLYMKRSCFLRSKLHKANIWDFIKMCTRWMFAKKYFFCVIHENGEVAPYWI